MRSSGDATAPRWIATALQWGCHSAPVGRPQGLQLPEAPKAQCSSGEATGHERPVKAAECPVFAMRRLFFSIFSFFPFPPHTPTDFIVSWRVRLEAPPREG